MTDITELVLQDHHAVAALFDKLQAATSVDDQTALFEQVRDALEHHASAEEKVLYPRVRKEVPDGREESKDAIEEHDQIRGSLKEVEEHEAGTELFTLAVTVKTWPRTREPLMVSGNRTPPSGFAPS